MGHRSIQVTIDVYGHLIPGENVESLDALDRAAENVTATDANRTQTQNKDFEAVVSKVAQVKEGEEVLLAAPQGFALEALAGVRARCRNPERSEGPL